MENDYKNNKSRRSFGRTDRAICKLYVSKGAEKWTEVYAVNNTYIYQYLTTNGITVKGFNNTDELLKNINYLQRDITI